MVEGVMDRCPTGIIGFDKMCQGGFIRNSDNLIVGGPGSGKSTFLLQFLWNGATKFGENGLYCSFEPDIVETLSDAMAYGWDFSKLSSEGRMKFMRFSPQTSIEELKSELTKIISQNSIKRVCFDPISVLALNLSEQGKIRQTVFELSALMKRLRVTSILADESLEGDGMQASLEGEWTRTDILRFLSDSVTIFYESGITGVGDRAVRIAKMRRTSHIRKAVGMKLSSKGVEVMDNSSSSAAPKKIEIPVLSSTPVPAPVVTAQPPMVSAPVNPQPPIQMPAPSPIQMQSQSLFSPKSNIPPRPMSNTVIKSTRFV
jgi:circadian clock protein KaiC